MATEFDNQMIAQLAAQQLGAAPAAAAPAQGDPAAAAAAAAAAQGAAPQQPKGAPAGETPVEKAAAAAAPTDGADDAALTFVEVAGKDGKPRKLTTQQIASTLDRYAGLNHRWQTEVAPMNPVIEVAKQIMGHAKSKGVEAKPEEVAQLMMAAIQAYTSNPTMGGQGKGPKGQDDSKGPAKAAMSPVDDDEMLSAWEKENAVSLPPGYKEQLGSMRSMGQQMTQMMQMLQQLAQGGGQLGQAQQLAGQANDAAATAVQHSIKNNMLTAFQQHGIDKEAEADFLQFAMLRGYSPEDFIDPQMAATVAGDYKANKDAPEINRLREIAQRRQAFTGSADVAPGAGGGAPAPQGGGDPMFAQMLSNTLQQRGIG